MTIIMIQKLIALLALTAVVLLFIAAVVYNRIKELEAELAWRLENPEAAAANDFWMEKYGRP